VDGKRRKERTWERQAGLVLNIPNMHIIIFTPQYHVLALEMHITIILFTWFNQPETRRDEKIKNVYIYLNVKNNVGILFQFHPTGLV
jgi:hypothetical protein